HAGKKSRAYRRREQPSGVSRSAEWGSLFSSESGADQHAGEFTHRSPALGSGCNNPVPGLRPYEGVSEEKTFFNGCRGCQAAHVPCDYRAQEALRISLSLGAAGDVGATVTCRAL